METSSLQDGLNLIVENLKHDLFQKSPLWSEIRSPSDLFDFEQKLQETLNILQANIVGTVLNEIHRDTEFVRGCQQQATQQRHVYSKGWRTVSIRTLGGIQTQIKTPYSSRSKLVDLKAVTQGYGDKLGIYPVLRRLGIVRRVTPRFLAEANRQMADGPSGYEVSERLLNREIVCTQSYLWSRMQDFSGIALWQRQQEIFHLDQVAPKEPSLLADKRVVLSFDGGRIRSRLNKQHEDNTKTREFTTAKCEPKLFVIYTLDQEGNKEKRGNVLYEGTILSVAYFSQLLKLRLQQLNIHKASLLVIIGDGASWIWKLSEKLQTDLKLQNTRVIEVVDLFHAVEKLTIPATIGISERVLQKSWFRETRRLLKNGQIDKTIEALRNLDQTNDHEQSIRKATEYFTTHKKRMQYKQFRAENLPLGSGVIESGIRRIINLRMKNNAMFWKPENAEAILYLRSQVKSQRWEAFVKSVLFQWAEDMSVPLRQALQIRQDIADQFLDSHPPVIVESRREVINWAEKILDCVGAVILDTETTGLGDEDEIIQISIIDIFGNVLLHSFLNPLIDISPEAQRVHGITKDQLKSAPTFPHIQRKIASLLSNSHVIAYNAKFDRRLLRQTCQRYGFSELEVTKWECAMEKYACFLSIRDGEGNYRPQSLTAACSQQGILSNGAHHATTDCLLTLKLITSMADTIE